jgi:hypothetical protein
VPGAVTVLCEAATAVLGGQPASLLLSPRQAVAAYADARLAADRVDEALVTARRALELPAEDVRGRTTAERVLARAEAAAEPVGASLHGDRRGVPYPPESSPQATRR